ncbi:hypothetical protein NKI96_26620 [Mesorhizobium sp. M0292]|uniref:hypothetical protein n=1 Tax=unclassified Mesorhizobium TaxID=325217 RepID=UPI0012EBDA90|nr:MULTISPECIES: hypothetical protein [unclassified Mesorhizobium]
MVFAGGIGTGFNARTGPEVKRRLDAIPMDKPPIPSLKANGAAWAECLRSLYLRSRLSSSKGV